MKNKIEKKNNQIYKESNKFLLTHSIKETIKRKGYYFLCFMACFLVCLVTLISKTVLNQGPIIFLMLGELKSGEIDIIIKNQVVPNYKQNYYQIEIEDYRFYYAFLNYTLFTTNFYNKNYLHGKSNVSISSSIGSQSVPRLTFFASAGTCNGCEEAMVDMNIIDTTKEREIELGRSYLFPKMKKGECIIHEGIIRRLKLDLILNQKIYLTVNMEILIRNLLINTYYDNTTHSYNENITHINQVPMIFFLSCNVTNYLDQNYGKSGQNNKVLLLLEQEYFLNLLSENLEPGLTDMFPDFPKVLNTLNITDYANQIIINFDNPRIDSYLVSDIDELQYKGVSEANKIIQAFGENGRDYIRIEMPVIDSMKPLFYGSIFLGLILNVIIVVLCALSLILIHSLLVITTETNTFELGLLRLLGTSKSGIIKIIIFQCLSFSIPACLFAYMAHFYVLELISNILSKYTDNGTHFRQNYTSVIISILVSNLTPLLAAIFPIKNLLSKNLAFSISSSSKSSGVHIEIISANERERYTLVTFGLLTFLYGASIYYFLPLSLLSINLSLLLAIFLWILIGMLLGFIVLSLNIENSLQKLFTFVFFFWTKTHTRVMIMKNLITHRIRNRQTSLMYALSVGFFIMITVGLDIELKSITLSNLSTKGAYVHLENLGEKYIKPEDIYKSLHIMVERDLILDYTFISAELNRLCFNGINRVMNIGKSMDFKVDVVAISPNFYGVAENVFLKIDEENIITSTKELNLAENMYALENEGRIGVSGIFTWEIDLHINDEFYLQTQKDSYVMPIVFKPSFILHSSPAIKMSAEPSTMYQRSVVMPIHTYLDIINKCWAYFITNPEDIKSFSYDEFPIKRILLKLNPKIDPEITTKQIHDIIANDPNYMVNVWFYKDSQKNTDKISSITSVIFYGVGLIVLIFCFFNLTASMTINIYEQKREIAILRSLGMKSYHIVFIYISESFILIFCSSFIGLIIGSVISWTMTLQRVVFTNLPLHFNFPYVELTYIILVSLLGGFLSTIVPAKTMLKNSISNLIRN